MKNIISISSSFSVLFVLGCGSVADKSSLDSDVTGDMDPIFKNSVTLNSEVSFPKPDAKAFDSLSTSLNLESGEVATPEVGLSTPYSRGSGGVVGYSVVNVAGVEMKIYTPPASSLNSGPVRLGFYLHGDSAGDHNSPERYGSGELVKWAQSKNMIIVLAKAPNGYTWWATDSSLRSGANYTANMTEAIKWMHSKYNIATKSTYFSGVSGGATFLSWRFIPSMGHIYPGAYALNCGGSAPSVANGFSVTPELLSRLKVYFNYTSGDYLADPNGFYGNVIGGAVSAYRNLGLGPVVTVYGSGGHCGFSYAGATAEKWEANFTPIGEDVDLLPKRQFKVYDSLCMDIFTGIPSAGQKVVTWTCHGKENQLWRVTSSGEVRGMNNFCLEMGAPVNGLDSIVVNACNGSPTQKWTLTSIGEIRSSSNNKCVDVKEGIRTRGTDLIGYGCKGVVNQFWK